MVYDWEAEKMEIEGKKALRSKDYNTATKYYEIAGGYHLKLANNSQDINSQLKFFDNAIKDYENAYKIVLHNQSVRRSSPASGSTQIISELREKGYDLSKKIMKINGTRDLLESRRKRKTSLEKNVFVALSLASFIFSIVFLSSHFTGFIVQSSGKIINNNAFGLIFFVLGIGFVLLYIMSRKGKK